MDFTKCNLTFRCSHHQNHQDHLSLISSSNNSTCKHIILHFGLQNKKKMFISRDTIFFENIFPYLIPCSITNIPPTHIHNLIPRDYPFEYMHKSNINNNIPSTTTHHITKNSLPSTTSYHITNSNIPIYYTLSTPPPNQNLLSRPILNYNSFTNSSQPLQTRKSTRNTKHFTYLHDCHCDLIKGTPHFPLQNDLGKILYPIQHFISYNDLSNIHKCLNLKLSSLIESTSYNKSIVDPNWKHIINHELKSLTANNTWDLIHPPYTKRPIGGRWILKIKCLANSKV